MTVLKRGKVYWVDFSHNRRRHRKPSPDNSYKGAQAYELLLRQKLARGEPLEAPREISTPLFKEVALQWLNVAVKNNNKLSEFKNRYYILQSDLIPYFGKREIYKINSYDVEQYKSYLLKKRQLAPKTINNRLCILSRCLKTAVEWGIMEITPKIKLLRVPPQKYDYLTEIETQHLLRHAEGIWHDMILLAVRTGLRFGELIALRWEDIDFQEKSLTVNRSIVRNIEGSPKNNKSRKIPLTSSVFEMLKVREKIVDNNQKNKGKNKEREVENNVDKNQKNSVENSEGMIREIRKKIRKREVESSVDKSEKNSGKNSEEGGKYVFHNQGGNPLRYDLCRNGLYGICKAAKMRRVSWHKLRHSFASHLAAKRVSIIAIKELLGHSDIKTTMRYAHVNLPVLEDAVRSLEMNDTIASQSKILQEVPAIIFR